MAKQLILKALIYRLLASGGMFLLALILTGDVKVSGWITAVELVGKTVVYFAYDYGWRRLVDKPEVENGMNITVRGW